MESITSVKIFHGSEYKANGKVIRWTEVSQSRRAACKPAPGILGLQPQPALLLTCSPLLTKIKAANSSEQTHTAFPTCKGRFSAGLRRIKYPIAAAQLRLCGSQTLQPALRWPPPLPCGS